MLTGISVFDHGNGNAGTLQCNNVNGEGRLRQLQSSFERALALNTQGADGWDKSNTGEDVQLAQTDTPTVDTLAQAYLHVQFAYSWPKYPQPYYEREHY